MGPQRGTAALALCLLLGHCGRAADPERRPEPGGWLAACLIDADCAVGQCTCGVCTASCRESDCSAGPPGSACIAPGHTAHDGFCAGRSSEPICLSACSESGECAEGARCVDGVCLPEAAAALAAAADLISEPLCGANPVVYRSLRVTNQTQLDLLAGCEVIDGDLTIELFPDADPTPLASLRVVNGALDVLGAGPEPPLLPLPAFPRLEGVGDLSIAFLHIEAPDRFPALRTLARSGFNAWPGELAVSDCTGIEDLSMFAELEGITNLALHANPDLARLDGLSQTSEIQTLSIGSNPRLTSLAGIALAEELWWLQLLSNERLRSLDGLGSVRRVERLELSDLDSLSTLAGLGGLERVSELRIAGNAALTSLAGLTALREVQLLFVENNPQLTTHGDWPAIEQIGGYYLAGNTALRTFAGLGTASLGMLDVSDSGLTDLSGLERAEVQSRLLLWNNVQLETLNGAPTLTSSATIGILDSPGLRDLSELSRTRELGELDLQNVGVANLDTLTGLEQLQSLELRGNPHLIHVDGVGHVRGLVELVARGNAVLERLPSFPNVLTTPSEAFAGSGSLRVELYTNPRLVEGPSFPAVDRALEIYVQDNPNLTRLNGFATLEAVVTLELVNNSSLADADFSNLREAASVSVSQNPLLAEDQLARLLQLASGAASTETP